MARGPTIKAMSARGDCVDDFAPLTVAEEKLRECAATGIEFIIEGHNGQRPMEAQTSNKIRSDFLRYMVLGGCEKTPVHARGIVLKGAWIDCNNGGLDLNSAKIEMDLSFHDCRFCGDVTLNHSHLQRLDFSGCSFSNTLKLRNATIQGNLICDATIFEDPNNALIANRARIAGDVDLENVVAKGTIAMTGSDIAGDFLPQGATLLGKPALQLRNTTIGGSLIWRSLGFVDGEVDFSSASCKSISTGHKSWMRKRSDYEESRPKEAEEASPEKQNAHHVRLDNFSYTGFSNLPDNCQSDYWVEWLEQQPDEHLAEKFKPRPWEQLASVLQSMGYEEEAMDIRVRKERLQTTFMEKYEPPASNLKGRALRGMNVFFRRAVWGPLVDYGYRPGNALIWLFLVILVGTAIYSFAAKQGIMTPTSPLIFKEARQGGTIPAWCAENWVYFPDENCGSAMPSEYSEFQSFIYAADVALPVVNLRMEDDWAPRVVHTDGTSNPVGWWVRTFEWFLIAAGWILSLLFVSAVGSSIRR